MRASSPELLAAFAAGANAQGADVIDIGLASTDQLYFASGSLNLPGAMFTASHNPARYNGIKLCRAGAKPVGQDTGLAEIQALAEQGLPDAAGFAGSRREHRPAARLRRVPAPARRPSGHPPAEGRRRRRQRHGRSHRAQRARRRPATATSYPCTSSSTARSPTTRPTRSTRRTSSTCRQPVREHGADVGLAFDGDADRCFVIDERGEPVSPSTVTALVAARELAAYPGRDGAPQPDHLARGARDRPRARRHARAHARRALVHQGRDGAYGRGLRR